MKNSNRKNDFENKCRIIIEWAGITLILIAQSQYCRKCDVVRSKSLRLFVLLNFRRSCKTDGKHLTSNKLTNVLNYNCDSGQCCARNMTMGLLKFPQPAVHAHTHTHTLEKDTQLKTCRSSSRIPYSQHQFNQSFSVSIIQK